MTNTMRVEPMPGRGKAAKPGTVEWLFLCLSRVLSLAATPTFALMALLTGLAGVFDSGSSMHAAGSHGIGGPVDGMVLMYLLMSLFHAAPWLKLLANRRRKKQAA